MSKPLTIDSERFLVIGTDEEHIRHLYQLRMNKTSLERAKIKFELLADTYGWVPFVTIEVIHLADDEELQSLKLL